MPTYLQTQSTPGQSKSAGTTVTTGSVTNPVAGSLVFASIVCDNIDLNNPSSVSIAKGSASETNDWFLVNQITAINSAGASCVIGFVYAIYTTVNWAASTITATLSGSVTAKAFMVNWWRNTGTGGNFVVHGSDRGASGFALGPLPIKADEFALTFTYFEDTSGFGVTPVFDQGDTVSSVSNQAIGTSGGGAASNVYQRMSGPSTTDFPNGMTANGNVSATAQGADGGTVLVVFGPARAGDAFTWFGAGIPV